MVKDIIKTVTFSCMLVPAVCSLPVMSVQRVLW